MAWTNREDPDQTASKEAVRLGFSLFDIPTSILWIQALKTNILNENRKSKVFKILEHLLYSQWGDNVNPFPANIFCPENMACLLRLLHIF